VTLDHVLVDNCAHGAGAPAHAVRHDRHREHSSATSSQTRRRLLAGSMGMLPSALARRARGSLRARCTAPRPTSPGRGIATRSRRFVGGDADAVLSKHGRDADRVEAAVLRVLEAGTARATSPRREQDARHARDGDLIVRSGARS
jgi:hypothetical protein